METLPLFFLMMIVHFAIDYQFQSDTVAKFKNPANVMIGVPWYYWMAGHAATHSIALYLLTMNIWIAVLEFILHFCIDWLKCKQKIGIHGDQCLHILCKVGYLFF